MGEPTAENAAAVAVALELTGRWEELMKTCPWRSPAPAKNIFYCDATRRRGNAGSMCVYGKCAIMHFMRGA